MKKHPFDGLLEIALKKLINLEENREEILQAFIAKHGFSPEETVQVIQRMADGSQKYWVEKRAPDLTPELIDVVLVVLKQYRDHCNIPLAAEPSELTAKLTAIAKRLRDRTIRCPDTDTPPPALGDKCERCNLGHYRPGGRCDYCGTKPPEAGTIRGSNEAQNDKERCENIAGPTSRSNGNRCTLRSAHDGAHVYGNCEYERRGGPAIARSHKPTEQFVQDMNDAARIILRASMGDRGDYQSLAQRLESYGRTSPLTGDWCAGCGRGWSWVDGNRHRAELEAVEKHLEIAKGNLEREIWCHAGCLTIAEGAVDVAEPMATWSPAMKAVYKLWKSKQPIVIVFKAKRRLIERLNAALKALGQD